MKYIDIYLLNFYLRDESNYKEIENDESFKLCAAAVAASFFLAFFSLLFLV